MSIMCSGRRDDSGLSSFALTKIPTCKLRSLLYTLYSKNVDEFKFRFSDRYNGSPGRYISVCPPRRRQLSNFEKPVASLGCDRL
jgi:hypothetical protein